MIDVILVASGHGIRMQAYTGRLFPKLLCTIGQETLLDRLFKNIEPFCSRLTIICNKHDKIILDKWIKTNCNQRFRVYFFEHEQNDGSYNALQDFLLTTTIEKCIVHWSDITTPNIKESDLDKLTAPNQCLIYGINRPMDCRFGIGPLSFGLHKDSMWSNVIGIYGFNNLSKFMYNLKYICDNCNFKPIDLADGLVCAQHTEIRLKYKLIPSGNLIDNGDQAKHLKIVRNSSNQARYFNNIKIGRNTVKKWTDTERGKNVMKHEINFYHNMQELYDDCLPKIHKLSTSDTYEIVMDKIDGKTYQDWYNDKVHNMIKSDNFDIDCNKKLIKPVILGLKKFHSLQTKSRNFDKSIKYEYVDTLRSRVEEISPLIWENPNKQFLIDFDKFSESPKNIDCSKMHFEDMVNRWERILENVVFKYAVIHGDPNTKNIMVDKDENIIFIDPRGRFGTDSMVGDVSYDFAKFIYGLSGYSSFNHAKNVEFDFVCSEGVIASMAPFLNIFAPLNIVIRDVVSIAYNITENDERFFAISCWYKALIGMIWLKLTGYIKNDPTKAIFAYMYGMHLFEKGIYPLENLINSEHKLNLDF